MTKRARAHTAALKAQSRKVGRVRIQPERSASRKRAHRTDAAHKYDDAKMKAAGERLSKPTDYFIVPEFAPSGIIRDRPFSALVYHVRAVYGTSAIKDIAKNLRTPREARRIIKSYRASAGFTCSSCGAEFVDCTPIPSGPAVRTLKQWREAFAAAKDKIPNHNEKPTGKRRVGLSP